MDNLNLEIILGLTGAGILGPTAWKLVPVLIEWAKERNAASSKLNVQSMSAAGLSVGYMASVLDTLQGRITQMKADHSQEFSALEESYETLRTRYEDMRVRSEKRIQELLDEIDGLKLALAKLGEEQ